MDKSEFFLNKFSLNFVHVDEKIYPIQFSIANGIDEKYPVSVCHKTEALSKLNLLFSNVLIL